MARCHNNDDACTLLGSARGFADSYQFGFPCTRGDRHRGPRFSRQQTLQSTSFVIQINYRVGGRVAPPVRPHHRAYGSVHGGSKDPLPGRDLLDEAQEAPLRQ